ncbi:hypothetical protein [Peribacillus phoenicis]|uniref:hypothetical protein n=1 Tax=unclassified Peribacillus TaxID=2675266 RepID=UPI0039A36CEC
MELVGWSFEYKIMWFVFHLEEIEQQHPDWQLQCTSLWLLTSKQMNNQHTWEHFPI